MKKILGHVEGTAVSFLHSLHLFEDIQSSYQSSQLMYSKDMVNSVIFFWSSPIQLFN